MDSICPIFVPLGIIISVGPQFITGIVVLLLKFVWIRAGPPHNSGNWEEKTFATAVAPAADAPCCEGKQFSCTARLLCGGILIWRSVESAATTPADRLKIVCAGKCLPGSMAKWSSNVNCWRAGRYVSPSRFIMSIPSIPPWFMGWQTWTGCEKVFPKILNLRMNMPITEISSFEADNSLICGVNLGGLFSIAIRLNCFTDIQDTDAPVSYNHVPVISCVPTLINGRYSALELPITSIEIVGNCLLLCTFTVST